MIDLAKLKDAGAVSSRARYLAVHRRSKPAVRSLIDVGAGRGNSSPVCPSSSGRKAGHSSSAPALNTVPLKRKSIQGWDGGGVPCNFMSVAAPTPTLTLPLKGREFVLQ